MRPKVPLFFVEAGRPAAVVKMIPAFWFRFDVSISVGWATPAGRKGARLAGMPDLGRCGRLGRFIGFLDCSQTELVSELFALTLAARALLGSALPTRAAFVLGE